MNFLYFQVRAAVIGNYKHDRLFGRGDEYGHLIIENAMDEVKRTGKFAIGRHESKSGNHVVFEFDNGVLVERGAA